jgi:phosphate transport system permease protein
MAMGTLERRATLTTPDPARRRREIRFLALISFATLFGVVVLVTLLIDVFVSGIPRLSVDFVSGLPSRFPGRAGVKPAIFGSLWVIATTAAFAVPVGVGAALYLEEYARPGRLARAIEVNISNLAGVPSIIYGLLGLAVFVRFFGFGRSVLAGGLTLGLLVLPVVITAAREAIKAVPPSIREAGLALGATKWQVTSRQVLPAAIPGIMTGVILAISRAIGEAAPLILLGAFTFITFVPTGILDRFTVLPIQIYNWVQQPQTEFQATAAAGIVVLLAVLLLMNTVAIIVRNRYSRKW